MSQLTLQDIVIEPTPPVEPVQADVDAHDRFLRIIAGVAGIGFGIVAGVALGLLAPSHSAVGRMFRLSSMESLIPAAILSIFVWGALLCTFRGQRLRALRQDYSAGELAVIEGRLHLGESAAISNEIKAAGEDLSPLQARLKPVLELWRTSPNFQEADLVLQQQIAHEEEEMHRAYGLVRLFVWALPVLGLIGTVIGISLAVGGFAEFLAGSVDDVSLIKKNLVNVTGGLSFAFLITLEGLVTSLVLMFWVSALQTNESRFVSTLHQEVFQLVAALKASTVSADDKQAAMNAGDPNLELFRQGLSSAAKSILVATQKLSHQLLNEFSSHLVELRNHNAQWIKEHAIRLPENSIKFSNVILEASAAMRGTVELLARETANYCDKLKSERELLAETLSSHVRAISEAQEHVASAVKQQSAAVATGATAIHDAARLAQETVQSHQLLVQTIVSSNMPEMLRNVEAMAEVVSHQAPQLDALTRSFDSLTAGTTHLLTTHETLQATTRELADMRLAETLASVRDALKSVVPALEGFRRPFVLQAVPVSTSGNGSPCHT
jgi:biopolymer transport protein ExbB/TolQ